MYVRKFEADTLEEALKMVKEELGPDAIILKTVTNKGLKGAFKKAKIEITAAVTEKTYSKKASVDAVLNPEQKKKLYSGSASYVSSIIDEHTTQHPATPNKGGYGNLGLNRTANTARLEDGNAALSNDFDQFLKSPPAPSKRNASAQSLNDFLSEEPEIPIRKSKIPVEVPEKDIRNFSKEKEYSEQEITAFSKKIDYLEKQIYELNKKMEKVSKHEPFGVYSLRTNLRSLNISEQYIQKIAHDALFELSEKETENSEVVFEFALKEMLKAIKTDMPLFLSPDLKTPCVSLMLSNASAGQTYAMLKMSALKKGSVLIKNLVGGEDETIGFIERAFGIEIIRTKTSAEIVAETRKAIDKGKNVFIDYRAKDGYSDTSETKKFVDGLRRSFENMEVFITLSAIHSELYNKKVVSYYRALADGIILTHLDLCLDFGALFNLADSENSLPFKFYGTGEVVPDDLELASAERILAGIFQFN